jgi:hypothetical protein
MESTVGEIFDERQSLDAELLAFDKVTKPAKKAKCFSLLSLLELQFVNIDRQKIRQIKIIIFISYIL